MKTQAIDNLPEIIWEKEEILQHEDGEVQYTAYGESHDGRNWYGVWVEIDGEFSDIIEITEA
jgi:hypothetical protein